MLRRIIVFVAVFMALAVLGLLLLKTQAPPMDLRRHTERLGHLQRVMELETSLDQEVARSRLALDAEPETLKETVGQLTTARQALRQSWLPKDKLPPQIDKAVRDYFRLAEDKQAELDLYRGDLQQFFSAFKQLRRQADPVLKGLSSEGAAALQRKVMSLLSELTTYSIQSNPANRPEIVALLGAISTDVRRLPDASLVQAVDSLLDSADSVRATKDGLRGRMAALSEIPTTPALNRAMSVYQAHYAANEAAVARYRLALAIYALALLSVFGLGGWRLRRSYAELDAANSHLEELVEVRTQELRKAMDELRTQQVQLIQSEKMASLGQLVAGVAHEINTPLGYARSNVETVREGLPGLRGLIQAYEAMLPLAGPQAGDALGQLQEAKRRWHPEEGPEEIDVLLADAEHGLVQISDLVISLKDFSRVDRSLNERSSINDGLDNALKICQGQLKHRIEVQREYGELPKIPCAPSQLNQVFLNLITNAAQAIDGPGWIRLRTRDLGDRIEIAIADNGCGMDEQTQQHIFEPFFTTKDVGKGTGLGLSIVYRILEDHQGSIQVRSALGQGTEFTILLPSGAAAAPAPRAVEVAPVLFEEPISLSSPVLSGL
ncbi:hypothetical protein D0B54_19335 [Solimonas sp. K1W22B-7]|uniref:ATP-binding protein n=1 Tax=Solimonas sp. K1W22B-7 TaxID=2303331 RepID=UPI000E32E095|nr:ATP-binding protein [Solimonas sp. K1W22B-7]AXQ30702.1 hypothetical protein D0B54_19335 [Solimonas sp. K1W22B-7]